jgi:hypothetical protein
MAGETEIKKRAVAKTAVYIEVELANGKKFIFDVDTATELEKELNLALASLNPPQIARARIAMPTK